MTKLEIRQEASRRMEEIEQLFLDMHVPSEVMALYMLLKLIHCGFEQYFAEFGLQYIRPSDVNDAKQNLNWGSIGPFERETLDLLKEKIKEKEMHHARTNHRPVTGLRAYG